MTIIIIIKYVIYLFISYKNPIIEELFSLIYVEASKKKH